MTVDRTKVSDREATMVITETAKSLGQNVNEFAINRSTVRTNRLEFRQKRAAVIKEKFQCNVPLVVHWDGKLIKDLNGNEKVDRLPVLVTGKNVSQLLTVAKLESGTGPAQAAVVFEAIEDWEIGNRVQAMCFDTTIAPTLVDLLVPVFF